jgi:hypothetical protein
MPDERLAYDAEAKASAERDQLRESWQGLAKSMREVHFVHPMNLSQPDPDRQYCDADNEPWPCPTYRRVMKAVGE